MLLNITGLHSRLEMEHATQQIRFELMDFNIYMRKLYERH